MEWVLDLALVGACLVVIYFRRTPRPSWIPPAAISCFVIAGLVFALEMPKSVERTPSKPLPKVEEVRKSFNASAALATADFLFHGNGFSIQVPRGFRWSKMQEPVMLLASRGDAASAIVVFRHELQGEPEPVVRQALDLMKQKNNTYEFSPLVVDSSSYFHTWFHVTKNGVPLRGLLIFAERDDQLWELTLTQSADQPDASLQRIAQTFVVD
jgi:hypothetical protein